MRNLLLAAALALCGATAIAQTNNLVVQVNTVVLEGRVVNATGAPVSGVQITLTAPAPGNPTSNLSPELAASLADRIASLIDSGNRIGVGQAAIDDAIATVTRQIGGATLGPQTNVITDAEGHFIFRDLGPGRYNVRALRDGYFGSPSNGVASTIVSKNVLVESGKPVAPVEITMLQGGIVSGRVRDPNGQAVSGMQVITYRAAYSNGRKIWNTVNTKPTDDRGEYRMFWLAPGEYYFGVVPRTPGVIPGPQDTWSRTFFPGVTEPSAASAVLVKGGEVNGIDINIRTGTGALFKISGVGKNPYAVPNPATGVVDQSIGNFFLVPREPGVLDGSNTLSNAIPVNARPNGEFEIRNVRPGSYDLIPYFSSSSLSIVNGVITQSSALPRMYVSHNPVEVRNADVTGLNLALNPGATLSGEVVVTGDNPQSVKMESLRLNLRVPPNNPSPQAISSLAGGIVVDAAGKFSTTAVPQDRYTFFISGMPPDAYIADMRQGGASVFDSGFVLDNNANPVQVVIDAKGVQTEVAVLDANRKPAAGAMVVLVPAVARRQNPALFRSGMTDDNGHATFKGVAPGQYTAYAWESVLPTAWQNPDFLNNYEGRGVAVSVEKQGKPQVELKLIPVEARQ